MDTEHRLSAEPIRLRDIASAIGLTTEQLVQMCRVSRRQLTYWIKRGIIPEDDTFAAIDRILLIKSHLRAGSNLRQATRSLERYVKEQDALLADRSEASEAELADVFVSRLDAIEQVICRLRDDEHQTADEELARLLRDLEAICLEGSLNPLPNRASSPLLKDLGRKQILLQRLAAR